MGENVKLAPCPFCGGKAVTKVYKGKAHTSIPSFSGAQFFRGYVKCTGCGVTTPQVKNPQAMTEAWNRRAALSDQERAVEVNDATVQVAARVHDHWAGDGTVGAMNAIRNTKEIVQSYVRASRSALVDVPVEPVAWQRRTDHFGWQIVNTEDLEHYRTKGTELRPLYTHPPHREGEDSAGWEHVQSFHRYPYFVKKIGGEWHLRMHDAQTAGVSRTISKHPTWQEALAATRSGSAITDSGAASASANPLDK